MRRILLVGMTASLAAHGLALVALLASAATSDDDDATLMVDVDVAPPVPEPIELPDEIANYFSNLCAG